MSKLYLLWATFLVGLVFILIPDNDITVGFPFSEMRVSLEYYIYSIAEKITLAIICFMLANESVKYREATQIFFYLTVIDLADMLFTYNDPWFSIGSIPVTFNIISIGVFGLVILNEIWKNR